MAKQLGAQSLNAVKALTGAVGAGLEIDNAIKTWEDTISKDIDTLQAENDARIDTAGKIFTGKTKGERSWALFDTTMMVLDPVGNVTRVAALGKVAEIGLQGEIDKARSEQFTKVFNKEYNIDKTVDKARNKNQYIEFKSFVRGLWSQGANGDSEGRYPFFETPQQWADYIIINNPSVRMIEREAVAINTAFDIVRKELNMRKKMDAESWIFWAFAPEFDDAYYAKDQDTLRATGNKAQKKWLETRAIVQKFIGSVGPDPLYYRFATEWAKHGDRVIGHARKQFFLLGDGAWTKGFLDLKYPPSGSKIDDGLKRIRKTWKSNAYTTDLEPKFEDNIKRSYKERYIMKIKAKKWLEVVKKGQESGKYPQGELSISASTGRVNIKKEGKVVKSVPFAGKDGEVIKDFRTVLERNQRYEFDDKKGTVKRKKDFRYYSHMKTSELFTEDILDDEMVDVKKTKDKKFVSKKTNVNASTGQVTGKAGETIKKEEAKLPEVKQKKDPLSTYNEGTNVIAEDEREEGKHFTTTQDQYGSDVQIDMRDVKQIPTEELLQQKKNMPLSLESDIESIKYAKEDLEYAKKTNSGIEEYTKAISFFESEIKRKQEMIPKINAELLERKKTTPEPTKQVDNVVDSGKTTLPEAGKGATKGNDTAKSLKKEINEIKNSILQSNAQNTKELGEIITESSSIAVEATTKTTANNAKALADVAKANNAQPHIPDINTSVMVEGVNS